MAYSIEISQDRQLATVRHSGAVDATEFERITADLEREFGKSVPRLLIDTRNITAYPNRAEFLLWIRNRTSLPSIGKIALITNPAYASTIDFIALASQNSGFDAQYFDDEEAALRWLNI